MLNTIKSNSLKLFALLLSVLTIFTVNSACTLVLGQDEEPESIKRFKKIK